MMRMMDEQVLPRVAARLQVRAASRRRAKTIAGRAWCARACCARSGWASRRSTPSSPTSPRRATSCSASAPRSPTTTCARSRARPRAAQADALLDRVCDAIRARLGPLVYGEGEETLEQVVGRLLRERGARVAVAESCTGGLVAAKLTDVPGSSDYFLGGVVAYADAAKRALLGVPDALLARARRGVGSGGARDGRGRARALRRGSRGRHHGHLGARRRQRGEAGRARARSPRGRVGHAQRSLRLPPRPHAPPPAHRAGRARLDPAPAARRCARGSDAACAARGASASGDRGGRA